MGKPAKTNAMRKLETEKIPYSTITYTVDDENFDGGLIAKKCGLDPAMVFKTLVLRGEKNGCAVFCIPVEKELDLKAAAQAAGEKKVEMVHVKELLGLTGYIRGGCSPVGMKKLFPTFFDESCMEFAQISVSAGVRGCQMLVQPAKIGRAHV